MGRHRKRPTKNRDVIKAEHVADKDVHEDVEDRLFGYICGDCNAKAPDKDSKCRKCGSSNIRRQARDYRNA